MRVGSSATLYAAVATATHRVISGILPYQTQLYLMHTGAILAAPFITPGCQDGHAGVCSTDTGCVTCSKKTGMRGGR